MPIVHMPWLPWSHVQLEWQNPEMQRWYEALMQESCLVRYDGRGTGLSDRNPEDFSLEAQIMDIEAVVDSLDAERFVLMSVYNSGPSALAYAARKPQRLAALILWCVYANGEDYNASPRVASIRDLMNDWELYTETGAHAFVGWNAGDSAHQLAALMREAVTPAVARDYVDALRHVDSTPCLAEIDVPVLVLHPRHFPLIDIDIARRIAAGIKEARLLPLEGDSMAPGRSNMQTAIEAIRELLTSLGPSVMPARPQPQPNGTPAPGPTVHLTSRETEILRLLAGGHNTREIADLLVLSPRTVERHIGNIYSKVNVSNRAQATAFAISNGLVA